ncbi:MAG: hypothetical protein ACE5F7_00110 [Nitrospiria bacterium]
MSDEQAQEKVGIGQKIVWGVIMFAGTSLYYYLFLNWVLMGPAQNLDYFYGLN